MIRKTYIYLLMLSGPLVVQPALVAGGIINGIIQNAGRNAAQNATLANIGDAIGDGINNIGNGANRMVQNIADSRRRRYEARRTELQAILDNREASREEKRDARRLMRELEEERRKQSDRLDNVAENIATQTSNLVFNGANTVMTELSNHLKHERDMQAVAIQASMDKKAKVEAARATAEAYIGYVKNNPGQILALAGGIFTLYFGAKHVIPAVVKAYQVPKLAQETSLLSVREKFVNWLTGRPPVETALKDVKLPETLAQRLAEVTDALSITVANNTNFRNLLFYGPPGTGKTMFALRMARATGLEYTYTAATGIDQFETEQAVIEVRNLFNHARELKLKTGKATMIVFDECEVLFGDRSKPNMSEKSRKLIGEVLAQTGTESNAFMLVGITNRPQDIDPAIRSRFGLRVEIPAPEIEQRIEILKLYIDKYLVNPVTQSSTGILSGWFSTPPAVKKLTVEEGAITDELIREIAIKLKGLTGREIQDVVTAIRQKADVTLERKVTAELIRKAVDEKLIDLAAKDDQYESKQPRT